ncbi:hypothetical protein BST61_g1745 [Cercospora zeina]
MNCHICGKLASGETNAQPQLRSTVGTVQLCNRSQRKRRAPQIDTHRQNLPLHQPPRLLDLAPNIFVSDQRWHIVHIPYSAKDITRHSPPAKENRPKSARSQQQQY